jgi:uncharacterized protein involved in type VI secretion and phage assembly
MEAREARQSGWLGRGAVRSLRPGTCFDLVGLPVDPANPSAEHRYAATDITHLGINNLSSEQIASVAQRLTNPETSTWLSEHAWNEKGFEDALAEFMENKGFS